jgi:hypothetical protein
LLAFVVLYLAKTHARNLSLCQNAKKIGHDAPDNP